MSKNANECTCVFYQIYSIIAFVLVFIIKIPNFSPESNTKFVLQFYNKMIIANLPKNSQTHVIFWINFLAPFVTVKNTLF